MSLKTFDLIIAVAGKQLKPLDMPSINMLAKPPLMHISNGSGAAISILLLITNGGINHSVSLLLSTEGELTRMIRSRARLLGVIFRWFVCFRSFYLIPMYTRCW